MNVKQPRHASAVSRRVRPSFAGNSSAPQILRSSNEEGAGKAGCPLHPWPACNEKSTRQQPQVHRNQPAFPARMVLTVSFALSSATRSFLPPSPCGLNSFIESPVGSIKPPQDLASATDARTTRLRRPRQHRSSCALPIAHELDSPCDSRLRARRRRVHRIPRSTSVTIAIRPSDEAGRAKEDTERDRREVDYFLRQDWTTQISLMRLDKSPFSRTRFFGHEGAPSRSLDPILPDGRIDQRKSWASDAMRDGGQVPRAGTTIKGRVRPVAGA